MDKDLEIAIAELEGEPNPDHNESTSPETLSPIIANEEELKLVPFKLDPKLDPHNWKTWKKAYPVFVNGIICLAVNMATSIISPGIPEIAAEFQVTEIVAVLSVSLMVVMFGFAPLIAAPLSEEIGRKKVLIFSLTIFIILQIGTAMAPNIGCLLALRFLSGIFGAPSLTLAPGIISDV